MGPAKDLRLSPLIVGLVKSVSEMDLHVPSKASGYSGEWNRLSGAGTMPFPRCFVVTNRILSKVDMAPFSKTPFVVKEGLSFPK